MTGAYFTIAGPVEAELEIKRSRFLCFLRPADTEDTARAAIAAVRSAHPKARHHCTAFVIGPRQELQRTNDDGEPSGTAGTPMLDALTGAELSDVVAVVVRYFGGILLGAGGLTRAYRAAVAEAVLVAARVRREERDTYGLSVDYATAAAIEIESGRRGWAFRAEYGAAVDILLAVPPGDEPLMTTRLAELTAGSGEPVLLDRSWVTVS